MQHRFTVRTGTGVIAFVFGAGLAILRADDPFPPAYPGGYVPSGQAQNGYYPGGGYQRSVVPSQPTAPVRPAEFPGGTVAAFATEAPAYGPLYHGGPTQLPGGRMPGPVGPPVKLCEWSQIFARVGNDVILARDVYFGIDDMMARVKGRIPPDKVAEQRAKLVEQVTAGVNELAAHYTDPDPVKALSPTQAGLLNQLLRQQIEIKLAYQDFLKNVPKEALAGIQENVLRHFEEVQLKILMKRENVVSRADLENALRAKGSSLEREKQIFTEQIIAQQWIQQKINPDDKGGKGDDKPVKEEVTHEEMLAWYQAHIKDFEHPAKARWEELMVSFERHPDRLQAYKALAAMGNRVLAGASLPDVARSASEGSTAREGGQRDWVQKDSLASQTLNDALFNLPVGQLSRILESADGYRIVRVVERQDQSRTSFEEAQNEIKEKIEKERFEKRYKEFLDKLRATIPVWTIFDKTMEQAKREESTWYSK